MKALSELSLQALGWTQFFEDQRLEYISTLNQEKTTENNLIPAKVVRQDVGRYTLVIPGKDLVGILPGKTRLTTTSKADLPTVGDWVLISENEASNTDQVVIIQRLERKSKFSRKEAGEKFDEQVVAANIDVVFIVTGLDDNFNPSRIERYLLLTWQSGAKPILVLNKSDICTDLEKKIAAVERVSMGSDIYTTSALTNQGITELRAEIIEGKTIAVMGSSGVGKSTLINQVLGYEHFDTGEVRETDSKGRHTTTHRELCAIESGGLIIDTPGMREIQFWADDDALVHSFDDVSSIGFKCKFNDCKHATEPGCAINQAIKDGTLDPARCQSYIKFQKELDQFNQQQSANRRMEKKSEKKPFTKKVHKRPKKKT